jgi:hypothetical protein
LITSLDIKKAFLLSGEKLFFINGVSPHLLKGSIRFKALILLKGIGAKATI